MKSTHSKLRRHDKAMSAARVTRPSEAEWMRREEMCKRAWLNYVEIYGIPDDIPVRPDLVYADEGWRGWQDFLGLTDSKRKGDKQ